MLRHEGPYEHCGMTHTRNDRARVEETGQIRSLCARSAACTEDASQPRRLRNFDDLRGCRLKNGAVARLRKRPLRPVPQYRANNATARMGIVLIALALLLRMLIPVGFMPATGEGFAISPCNGMAAMPEHIDEHGQVHKEQDRPDKRVQHPCAFAAFGSILDHSSFASPAILPSVANAALAAWPGAAVAVGRGLAAPPPPSTGPPAAA